LGFAVGEHGLILKTTDGGVNWTNQLSGTSEWLLSVCFNNSNTGYIVGDDGIIMKTTDGGTSWTRQTSGTLYPIYSISFIDAGTGYAVGDKGTILKTTNGGTNWNLQISGTSNGLGSVYFTEDNTVFAVGEGATILKSTSGGVGIPESTDKSFQLSISPNPAKNTITIDLLDLSGFQNIQGFIFNVNGQLIKHQQLTVERNIVNISDLRSGLYIMKVYAHEKVLTGKFVKN
jgi:hypothetical protein